MEKQNFLIGSAPAILWGKPADKLILAVHGAMSNKADDPIALLAAEGEKRGFRVLSFDLPNHGENRDADASMPACGAAINEALKVAFALSKQVSVFCVSMGAFLTMSALNGRPIENAYFLSPVVDMKLLTLQLMEHCSVTPEALREQGTIVKDGQTFLYADWEYMNARDVSRFPYRTHILYGENDMLSDRNAVEDFARRNGAKLTVMPGGEHWFHTPEQLNYYKRWLETVL